jgi:hypothetical protein
LARRDVEERVPGLERDIDTAQAMRDLADPRIDATILWARRRILNHNQLTSRVRKKEKQNNNNKTIN